MLCHYLTLIPIIVSIIPKPIVFQHSHLVFYSLNFWLQRIEFNTNSPAFRPETGNHWCDDCVKVFGKITFHTESKWRRKCSSFQWASEISIVLFDLKNGRTKQPVFARVFDYSGIYFVNGYFSYCQVNIY